MNGHEAIRKILPLCISGDISPAEAERVREHLLHCDACRQLSGDYSQLANALREMPTPQPGNDLVARVRDLAESQLAQTCRKDNDTAVLVPLVAVSWISALATWPLLRAAGKWAFSGWHLPGGSFGTALTAYSILGLFLASVAAIAVGSRANAIGRMR